MKRSIIVGLACLMQLSAFAQAVVGTWKGDLKVGMSKLSLIFHVSKDTCTLDVPARGAIDMPASLKELTDTSTAPHLFRYSHYFWYLLPNSRTKDKACRPLREPNC